MDMKTIWLDSRQIKALRNDLQCIGSSDLIGKLDDYILSRPGEGAYMCNLLSNHSYVELKMLNEKYCINPLSFLLSR